MRWNIWGSSSDNADAGPSQATEAAPAQQGQPAQASTSTPTPAATARAPEPPLSRYERALKEEEKLQDEMHPTYEDVPKCMTLL